MQDFTEGNIGRQVVTFSTPLTLGNLLLSVYGIINMIWVGRLLGSTAVAAVAASIPIIMLLPAFLIGLGMATNILIAQAFGRKDTELLRKILANASLTSLLFCLLISMIGLLLRRQMLEWVQTPPEIQEMALSYLTIIIAGLVFQFSIHWISGMLRGMGDAKTVMNLLIVLTVLNIILVPVLIGGIGPLPSFGVAGAAWGTVLASAATCVFGYLYLLRRNPFMDIHTWNFTPDWQIIRQVFVIGIPASLQMIVVSLSGVFIVSMVNGYGSDVTAAFGIGMQVDMLAVIPVMSIGMAATSIAAQNLGAGKIERVLETLRKSIWYGLITTFFCSAALFLFSRQIGAVFLEASAEHAAVLDLVGGYYRWIAFIFPCFAVIFAIQGVLRSAGDTMAVLFLSFIALIVIRIPLAWLLAYGLGYKQDGIWMAMLFSSALAVALNWLYFRHGPWKKRIVL